MEMIQLLSLYEIVKTGTLVRASQNVFRSQPAISHQIKNLEEELGIKLFERLGKRLKLTDEGKILFDIVSRFLNDLDNLKRIYQDMEHGKTGNLTIATSSAAMAYLLPNVIKMFKDEFPKVKFKLITCSRTSETLSTILNGEADFGIGPKSNELLPDNMNFLFWKYFDRILITAKGYSLSKKKAIKLSDIATHPFILPREGTIIRKVLEEAFFRKKLSYEIIMETDLAENIKTYVAMGIGISILSSFTLTKEDRNRLFFLNVNNLFGKTKYGIYYRKGKYVTASMRQFINCFAPELLGALPIGLHEIKS